MLQAKLAGIYLHVFIHPYGTHQHVPLGMGFRLQGGDAAAVNQIVHIGMVPGNLPHGALPHQIKAAVAYMSPYRLVSFKMEAGSSSSHAPALRVPLDAGKDGTVAPDDHAPEPVLIQAALML